MHCAILLIGGIIMAYQWKEETINSLKDLGGIAHINDIFQQIVKRGYIDLTNSKTPERTLSRVLQTYSQSTDYGIDNTFYCVYGVNAHKGVWGLVDYQLDNMKLYVTQDDISFAEGKEILRKHIIRERNQALIKTTKQKFKHQHNGKLFCEICGFNFIETYGELGKDYIEAHHIKPISEMQDNEKTNIDDIVMLCSNCHSMIHRKRPWINKEDLKSLLKK